MALMTGLQARLQHGPPRKLIGASRILSRFKIDLESVQNQFRKDLTLPKLLLGTLTRILVGVYSMTTH